MKDMFKKLLCLVLTLASLLSSLPVPAGAEGVQIDLPQDEISEEILTSGEFYIATAAVALQEDAAAPHLLKIARGGEDLPEATLRLDIMDITASYGKDYKIKLHNSSIFGTKVKNALSSTSILDEILESGDEMVEENYTDALVSGETMDLETAEALYQEDLETLDAFLTEEVEGYAEEKEAALEAIETAPSADTLAGAKELATGLKSDKVPMDGGGENALAAYTEEMLAELSMNLGSAYLMVGFAEGETEKYIEIIPKNNGVGDGDRMFSLNLFAASEEAVVSDLSASTVQIIDDEEQAPATVSFSQMYYQPENGYIKVTVEREGAINQMISVRVKTEDDSALKDRDYSQVDTEVAFPYGITKRTINIPIRSDYIEGSAQFKLVLTEAKSCTIGEIDTAYGEISDTSTTYSMLAAAEDDGPEEDSRMDANVTSYFLGEPISIPKRASRAHLSQHAGGYSKVVDDEFEMYTTYNIRMKFDVDTMVEIALKERDDQNWFLHKRWDTSGVAIEWTKSSRMPCYTETKVCDLNSLYDWQDGKPFWISDEERWDRRTTNVYFPYADVESVIVKQTRNGSIFGTSPTLRIHSVTPILRPFEITLKGAEPLQFLNEKNEYVDNTQIAEVADANRAILRNATETGTGTVVKFGGDTVTVTSSSKFSYLKGLKIVNNETGASKTIIDDLPVGTTSASFVMNNDFLIENNKYLTFSANGELGMKGAFSVQPIFAHYDTTVTVHTDYRGHVSCSGNPTVSEGTDGTTLTYHKGDRIHFTQSVKDAYASSYTGSRIRFVTKDNSTADRVDNKRAYDVGTTSCSILNTYSDIDVYPNFDKKDNHIIVRVAKKDLAKFHTNVGIFTCPVTEVGDYMEYTVVDSDGFAADIYYEFSARTKDPGVTPIWQKVNTDTTYSQPTFYFESTNEIEENIILLTCGTADPLPFCLTGDAYYSNVTLNGGIEGTAWMKAGGVLVAVGDAYGISNEEGNFNTAGIGGISGMSVIYKTVASGRTEYKTALLSDEKVSQFGSSGVEQNAYDVSIGTIHASVTDHTAPYVAAVVAANSENVESGYLSINDKATTFTAVIQNNGAQYYDTDGTARLNTVTAVDFLVYDSFTHQLKSVLTGAGEISNVGGMSVWTYTTMFKKGQSELYAAGDELYIRLTTNKVIGNGMGYDADGNEVELETLKQTEYAPLNTGYTFVEANRTAPVYHELDFTADLDFIPLPIIGTMTTTTNFGKFSLSITELPNGGLRLSFGRVFKGEKLAKSDAMLDSGTAKEKLDSIGKAATEIKNMGQSLKEMNATSPMSSVGMRRWGLAPLFGIYLDFGIKNIYYTEYATQKLVFIGGGLYLGGMGKFRVVQYFVLGTVPVYFGIEGDLTIYGEVGFVSSDPDTLTSDKVLANPKALSEDLIPDNLTIGAQSYIHGYAGVGLCGILGVRGGFGIYPSLLIQPMIKNFYPEYSETGGFITVQLKVWLDAFLFPIPIPAYTAVDERFGYFKQLQESDKGELPSTFRRSAPDGTDEILMKPRTEASQWLPDSNTPMLQSTFVPDTSTTLLENGYDRADSQLLDLGDGRVMLAMIADDAARTDKDRTALMYSIYDRGTWSQPVTVQNDGTADFEPNLCDAGDKVLISWTSRAPETNFTSETEFLTTLEVYTTTLDKDTLALGEIERLTEDSFYDSAPVGIYDEISGDYVVYYLKSDVGGDFMTSVSPTTNESVIVYMLYDAAEGKWARDYYYDNEVESEEAEDILVEYWGGQRFLASPIEDFGMNDPIIIDFDAISYNGIGVYTYTVDEDNNMDTDADRELFVQAYDFESHSTYVPVRITTDNLPDARPQLVRNDDHTYLFWLRNNEDVRYLNISDLIKNGVNDDGTIKADYELNVGAVSYVPADINVKPSFGSYTAFVDKDSNLYIAWLQPVTAEDGSSSQEIYASALIGSSTGATSWSEGVRLTESGAIHDEVALVTDASGDLLTVSNQYTVDLASETYGIDNIKLVATKYKVAGSLEIMDVSYSNDAPQAGTTVDVNATIKNTGLKTAAGYTLNVYEMKNGIKGKKVYSVTSDTVITPSSRHSEAFTWTLPASFAGTEDLALYLEIQEAEMSEIETFTGESIQLSPVYEITNYVVEQGENSFYATYTVKNIGNIDAVGTGDHVVIEFSDLYFAREEVEPFLDAPIGDLKINETKSFTEELQIDERYFEFGYTNAYMEVQDAEGNALSDFKSLMLVVEHPYDIAVNGDKEVTRIHLKKGDKLPLTVSYAADDFYQGAKIGYDITDTSVASVKDGVLVANEAGQTEMTVMVVPFGGSKTLQVVVEEGTSKPSRPSGGTRPTVKEEDEEDRSWNNPFRDVSRRDWFYENVKFVNENGLFGGTTANTFSPNDALTRAMLVTVLYRAEGEPKTANVSKFRDVASTAYYAKAVAWAEENGIVSGVSETAFAPDAKITREQIAAILYRYAVYNGLEAVTLEEHLAFKDAGSISEYAVAAMNWIVGRKVINGYEDGTVRPQNNATRAEAAAMLQRFLENQ